MRCCVTDSVCAGVRDADSGRDGDLGSLLVRVMTDGNDGKKYG